MKIVHDQQDSFRRNARAAREAMRADGVDEATLASTPDIGLAGLARRIGTQLALVPDVDQSACWAEDPDCAAVTWMFKTGRTVEIPVSPFDDGFGGSAA